MLNTQNELKNRWRIDRYLFYLEIDAINIQLPMGVACQIAAVVKKCVPFNRCHLPEYMAHSFVGITACRFTGLNKLLWFSSAYIVIATELHQVVRFVQHVFALCLQVQKTTNVLRRGETSMPHCLHRVLDGA